MNVTRSHPAAEKKEPFVRMVKRSGMSPRKAYLIRALALICALITGALIILLLGHNPIYVYADMIKGSFGSRISRIETVKIAIPLLGSSLCVALAFKMKFWNIGAEGQILAGAIAASYIALFHHQGMPGPLLLIVMFLAAVIAGGIWGLIPAIFKARWNINETLFTLMFNYIALGFINYLQNGPWKETPGGFPKIAMFAYEARLPKVFGVHIGWIIVLVLVLLVYGYMRYTKHGYEISVVGESSNTALYAGMNVRKIITRTMFISGAIAGLVGFMQVSGSDYTLTNYTANGVGFTAITVAWLSKLNPLIMVAVSAFLAILQKGSNRIQTDFKIPASASSLLTGIILFFMLGCEFFITYKLIFRKGQKNGRNR
jgi:simple sugar transport system permease protein